MKKYISYSVGLLAAIITIISCTKDITVNLPSPQEKIVIEGMIETDDYPVVFLTKNSAYFAIVDTTVVAASIIKNSEAIVIVSNGVIIDTLNSVLLDRWPYFGYQGSKFKGEINSTYDLKVLYNDKTFTASTFIPDTVGIDSVWFDLKVKDSLGFLAFRWKDPVAIGNYYTVLTKIEGQQKWFYRPFFGMHLIDDKLDNSNERMTYTPLTRGYERNAYYSGPFEGENIDFMKLICFQVGDTVSIKLSTIDAESYNFWSSVYRNVMTNGNPFTNPASVKSNIYGDPANGYWIGSGSFVRTVYISDSTNVEILR